MAPLSDEHRKLLRETSGISDEVIEVRGYRTVPKDELVQLGIEGKYDEAVLKAGGAMAFKVMRPDGQYHCEVLRLDHAITDRKYLWPSGTRQALDVYPGHLEYIADPNITLLVAEGSKKVDAIVSHIPENGERCCVIGINGCWGWRSRVEGVLGKASIASPDFHDIALDGRKIIYIPDSDYYTNSNVKKGWDGCGEYLASKTKPNKLSVCVVPPKGLEKRGADDYLLEHSLEDLMGYCRSVDIRFDIAKPELNWVTMNDVLKEESEVTWLVDQLLPAGGIGLLVGHTRSYKTWHAMRLCLDLILGRNAWGHPILAIPEPVNVLYINMEMVRPMLKQRMEDFLVTPELHTEEVEKLLEERFFVLDNKTFDLRNSDHVTWLIEHIKQDTIKMGVIDTFSMVWQGNENDAAEVGSFFKTMRMISELTGITWLILHHMAKPNKDRNEQHQMFAIRGSGQILQQVDAALGLEVVSDNEEGVAIKVTHFKSRSASELSTWTNLFTRPEDTKARDIVYQGEYSAPIKARGKQAQEEQHVLTFIRNQADALVVGLPVARMISVLNTIEETREMGQNKFLKILQQYIEPGIVVYDKDTQTYTKGEHFDDIIEQPVERDSTT